MFYTHRHYFHANPSAPNSLSNLISYHFLWAVTSAIIFMVGNHQAHVSNLKKKRKKKKSNHMAYESKIGWTESAYTFAMRVSKAHQLFLELVKSYRLCFSSHYGTAITAGGSSPQSTLQKLFREKVFQLKVQSVIYPCTQCL